MTPSSHCPICDAEVARRVVAYRREADQIVKCESCGSLFSDPRPSREELDRLYEAEYYGRSSETAGHVSVQVGAESLHRTVLKLLARCDPRLIQPGNRILDYGCGLGYFLRAAMDAGMDATGIEMSPAAASFARETNGVRVLAGDEAQLAALPDGHFHIVTCASVLEHVLRPRETLRMLVGKLAPGGLFMAAVPNMRCWRYMVEKGRWFNIVNPTHLNFFSLAALKEQFSRTGLTGIHRPVYWGGRPGFGLAANAAQFAIRLLNLGSEVRLIAQKAVARVRMRFF